MSVPFRREEWISAYPLSAGSGTISLGIPNESRLIGSKIHTQSYVPAPGHNPAGVITSNGGTLTLGTW